MVMEADSGKTINKYMDEMIAGSVKHYEKMKPADEIDSKRGVMGRPLQISLELGMEVW